jgi:hypothetical protein
MEKGVGVHMVARSIAAYRSYAVAISSVVQTPAIILTGGTPLSVIPFRLYHYIFYSLSHSRSFLLVLTHLWPLCELGGS